MEQFSPVYPGSLGNIPEEDDKKLRCQTYEVCAHEFMINIGEDGFPVTSNSCTKCKMRLNEQSFQQNPNVEQTFANIMDSSADQASQLMRLMDPNQAFQMMHLQDPNTSNNDKLLAEPYGGQSVGARPMVGSIRSGIARRCSIDSATSPRLSSLPYLNEETRFSNADKHYFGGSGSITHGIPCGGSITHGIPNARFRRSSDNNPSYTDVSFPLLSSSFSNGSIKCGTPRRTHNLSKNRPGTPSSGYLSSHPSIPSITSKLSFSSSRVNDCSDSSQSRNESMSDQSTSPLTESYNLRLSQSPGIMSGLSLPDQSTSPLTESYYLRQGQAPGIMSGLPVRSSSQTSSLEMVCSLPVMNCNVVGITSGKPMLNCEQLPKTGITAGVPLAFMKRRRSLHDLDNSQFDFSDVVSEDGIENYAKSGITLGLPVRRSETQSNLEPQSSKDLYKPEEKPRSRENLSLDHSFNAMDLSQDSCQFKSLSSSSRPYNFSMQTDCFASSQCSSSSLSSSLTLLPNSSFDDNFRMDYLAENSQTDHDTSFIPQQNVDMSCTFDQNSTVTETKSQIFQNSFQIPDQFSSYLKENDSVYSTSQINNSFVSIPYLPNSSMLPSKSSGFQQHVVSQCRQTIDIPSRVSQTVPVQSENSQTLDISQLINAHCQQPMRESLLQVSQPMSDHYHHSSQPMSESHHHYHQSSSHVNSTQKQQLKSGPRRKLTKRRRTGLTTVMETPLYFKETPNPSISGDSVASDQR